MKKALKGLLLIGSIVGLVACNNTTEATKKIGAEDQGDVLVSKGQAMEGKKDINENEISGPAENATGGMALEVPGREDLKTLVSETEFILAVDMTNDYEVVRTPIVGEKSVFMIDHKYQVTIEEVFKKSNQMQLQAGDSVRLVVPVGMQQRIVGKEEGELIPLFDNLPVFEEGEYLLFLEQFPHDSPHAKEFAPSNMNHIYRGVGDEYQNIVSDLIPVIKKDESF